MVDTIQNTFARLVNSISGSEVGKIPKVELRGVGGLLHLEGEAEIAQKELTELGNRKIVEDLGGG